MSGLPIKTVCISLTIRMRATCPANTILLHRPNNIGTGGYPDNETIMMHLLTFLVNAP
jgi:hypothetical protein